MSSLAQGGRPVFAAEEGISAAGSVHNRRLPHRHPAQIGQPNQASRTAAETR